MVIRQGVTRRTLLVGGCSAALVGCEPPNGGGGGSSGGPSFSDLSESLPSWTEIGLFLTMGMVAGHAGGALAGAIGLVRLAGVLRKVGVFADRAGQIHDSIELLNQLRSTRFALPMTNADPRPFIVPAEGDINDFESVPVFMNDVTLQFGILNEDGGNFGDNQIYATVKRADERPPRTLDEVWGSGDLPHAIVTPASNGSYDGTLSIGALPPGAYVSYSWKVPRGRQPSDEHIASSAFVGPAFLAVDDANYTLDLADAVSAGKNVQARFQLPDASLG